MKTKIFLPVLAMLSLMLFSFTTNNNEADYQRLILMENGSYLAQGVPFSEPDMQQLSRIENNFDELTEHVYGISRIFRRSLGPDWFEEEIVWDYAFEPAPGNEERFYELRRELDGVMEGYLRY
jgi:hypothetical protein